MSIHCIAHQHREGGEIVHLKISHSEDLLWTTKTTALVNKAQKWLYFLRTLRRVNPSKHLLLSFYCCSIMNQQQASLKDILTSCCLQKIHNILKVSFLPANHLLQLWPSGKCNRSIKTHTRYMNSSFRKPLPYWTQTYHKHYSHSHNLWSAQYTVCMSTFLSSHLNCIQMQ